MTVRINYTVSYLHGSSPCLFCHQYQASNHAQAAQPSIGMREDLTNVSPRETEKISVHNSIIFKSRFSMKMPKLDFFDSLVRPRTGTRMPGETVPDTFAFRLN